MTAITIPRPNVDSLDARYFFEIVNGKRTENAPMGAYANLLAAYLSSVINHYAMPRNLGFAATETLHRLGDEKSRRPDVSFMRTANMPDIAALQSDPAELPIVPDLAVEVISPSNTADEIEEKILDYFSAGVQLVWVIYPRQHRVHVFETSEKSQILKEIDSLDGGAVIPGFTLKLADLFKLTNQSA